MLPVSYDNWLIEQFLNGTSAQYRLYSAILLKLHAKKLSIYSRLKNNSSRDVNGTRISRVPKIFPVPGNCVHGTVA